MEHWYGQRPLIFENRDLDLAVAVGAAYYSYVALDGHGRAGARRSAARVLHRPRRRTTAKRCATMCLVPRGTEEGATLELDPENLQLVANKPVSFRLYSSLTRTEDHAGDVVAFDSGRSDGAAPARAAERRDAIRQDAGERLVPVKLGAQLTEVGTLEIWADSKISEHRWRLQFELRKAARREAAAQQARGGDQRRSAASGARR